MTFVSGRKSIAEIFRIAEVPKMGQARLVYVAIGLIYDHGFQAVGIDRIIAEAGVTKTTFYKHFESKDDLLIAAIHQRNEWESSALHAAIQERAGDDPRARLLALFDVFDLWFNAPDYRGCQFINAAAEFPNPHDPVHVVAAEYKRKQWDWYRDLATAAGICDAESFADQYAALVEGTLILRQIHGRNDAAHVIKPAVESLLLRFLPS